MLVECQTCLDVTVGLLRGERDVNRKELVAMAVCYWELQRAGRVRLIDHLDSPHEQVLVLFVLIVAVTLLYNRRWNIRRQRHSDNHVFQLQMQLLKLILDTHVTAILGLRWPTINFYHKVINTLVYLKYHYFYIKHCSFGYSTGLYIFRYKIFRI